jgi:signal transduction histidine kinase
MDLDTVLKIGLYITTVVNVVLSLVIFSRGISNITNLLFGFFTGSAAIWTASIIGFYYFPQASIFVSWVVYTHVFALGTSFAFMLFTFFFPQDLSRGKKTILSISAIVFFALIAVLFLSDLIVGKVIGIEYELGVLYPLYSVSLIAFFFTGYYALVRQYKLAVNDLQKIQTSYVATSGIVAPTLAIIPDLILPYFGVFEYTWMGPPFTLIMVVALFIAMVRFQLFNIKVIATEIFATLIIIILLAQLFIATNATSVLITTLVLCMVAVSAFLLIRSVYREVDQREVIQGLYKELEIKNQKLVELDKLKSQFLSIATHELRTPLTIVRNFISLMLDGTYGKVNDALAEGGRQVFQRVDDMARSVDTYLNVSRIEQGKIKYDFAPANFSVLVETAYKGLLTNAEKKKLALTLSVAKGAESIRMRLDAPKITEVLINLIDNSIKYTPKGSVHLSLERVGQRARFTISDTGVGMTEKTQQNLFKLFSPGEDSKKINPASTGVGLYVSKAHVEAHRGTLTATSAGPGKGSQFVVELPLFYS